MLILFYLFFYRFVFNNCTVELDITIIDRISALLNPLPVCVIQKPSQNVWNVQHAASGTSSQSEYKMDIKITSPSATLKLRYAFQAKSLYVCTMYVLHYAHTTLALYSAYTGFSNLSGHYC